MWSTYFIQTTTGAIGPKIEGTFSWSLSKDDGEISLTLAKSAIPTFNSNTPYLTPWWGGVVLFWNSTPIMAGPITSIPNETFNTIQVSCKSIWSILNRRTPVRDMVDWNKINTMEYRSQWSTVTPPGIKTDPKTETPISQSPFYNKEYYSMARLTVEYSLKKNGGNLPIDFSAVPIVTNKQDDFSDNNTTAFSDTDTSRNHFRIVKGPELNKTVASELKEISDKVGGPEITFRPYLNTAKQSIVWKMLSGLSESKPNIPGDNTDVWDTTAHGSDITDLSVSSSGSKMMSRVFAQGPSNGDPINIQTNTGMLKAGYPLLESLIRNKVGSKSSATDVKNLASTYLAIDSKPRRVISGTIRANSEIHPLGTYWPGDTVTIVTAGWRSFPNGIIKAKIDSMSGDSSMNISVSFAEEMTNYEDLKQIERMEGSE